MAARRITLALDARHTEKLADLAARTAVDEDALAESLLVGALDEADPDPERVTALLEGISGALERAREGSRQAAAGGATPLHEL